MEKYKFRCWYSFHRLEWPSQTIHPSVRASTLFHLSVQCCDIGRHKCIYDMIGSLLHCELTCLDSNQHCGSAPLSQSSKKRPPEWEVTSFPDGVFQIFVSFLLFSQARLFLSFCLSDKRVIWNSYLNDVLLNLISNQNKIYKVSVRFCRYNLWTPTPPARFSNDKHNLASAAQIRALSQRTRHDDYEANQLTHRHRLLLVLWQTYYSAAYVLCSGV